MREEIIYNIDNPRKLEKLFRENKTTFKREFNIAFPGMQDKPAAQIWNERLNFESDDISWGTQKELVLVIIASCMAGLIAKIPDFFAVDPDFFYMRNIAFIVFPFLTLYFAWKQNIQTKNLIVASVIFLIAVAYINMLPINPESDTLVLACIHLPLLLWAVFGFAFVGDKINNYEKRIDFLRFNGDLIVMTTIILIAGGLLTAITLGLFELIEMDIAEIYFQYIGIWGLAASPIIGTYLVQTNPQLVNKVSPVIARVFTPLIFIMLVVYLTAVIYTGRDPYNDRDFLIIFNLLLIGVMAIILFSIAEISKNASGKIGTALLIGLSFVTIIVNGIALSAIVFRITEWGITPNRLAVLVGNILILINLIIVAYNLFKVLKDKNEIGKVEKSIASYIPIYIAWAIVVVFIFPFLFGFR